MYSKEGMHSRCIVQIAFTSLDIYLHVDNEEDMLNSRCLCDIYIQTCRSLELGKEVKVKNADLEVICCADY